MIARALQRGRLARIRRAQNRAAPPPDFEDFWSGTLERLLDVSVQPVSSSLPGADSASVIAADITSWEGGQIRCWFSGPCRSGTFEPSRPLLVTSHGYGGRVEPERVRRLASFGMDVVGVDMRGFGLSKDAVDGLSPYGYVLTGWESPQTSILRGAVCDFIQAYRAARKWFGAPSRVSFEGFSFAGGMATMAAGVVGMAQESSISCPWLAPPDLLAVGVPTLGHYEKRLALCQDGSGKEVLDFLRLHPQERHALKRTFSYFDTTFFAPHVNSAGPSGLGGPPSILGGVGVYDPVVPAETVYSIFNAFPHKPEVFEMPCSHTTRPEEAEWARWEKAWIDAASADATRNRESA